MVQKEIQLNFIWEKISFRFSETIQPKYVNSNSTSKSIDSLFLLPGLFNRLIVELTDANRTCSIEYSSIKSPFYHCLFNNLPPAQQFVLTSSLVTTNNETLSGDIHIVYTGMSLIHSLNFYISEFRIRKFEFFLSIKSNKSTNWFLLGEFTWSRL